MWRAADLEKQFDALGALLMQHQAWWRPRAFSAITLPWEFDHPGLAGSLREMSLAEAERIAASNDALRKFFSASGCAPLSAVARTLQTIEPSAMPVQPCDPLVPPRQFAEARDVPGRKWQQILAFAQALPDASLPATEWCAGKAHLGRHYARIDGAPVVALEWQTELVDDGNRISQRERLPVQSFCADVLAASANDYARGARRMLALHACGQLHIHLLQTCVREQPQAIALAPCCYQLQPAEFYSPLSHRAQNLALSLTRLDLKTAVQESVTSPERVQKQRRQLQAWRLGFDVLQRELRGRDDYLPTPPLPLTALKAGFESFCVALAQRNAITLPADLNFGDYASRGEQRLREVAALDLTRLLFRRALELWLVLDRALYLQENGYDVSVGTFCERALTPRNVLIQARRSA
jgi:hypothetical protein